MTGDVSLLSWYYFPPPVKALDFSSIGYSSLPLPKSDKHPVSHVRRKASVCSVTMLIQGSFLIHDCMELGFMSMS